MVSMIYYQKTMIFQYELEYMFTLVAERIPAVPSSSEKVSYKKTRTSSGGFNFRKDSFYCGCVITDREKKTKKSCNVSRKNRGKMMSGSLPVSIYLLKVNNRNTGKRCERCSLQVQ